MNMGKRTFFIVPGFGMQAKDKAFEWLVSYLETKGFWVVKTPVDWKYKTLSTNTSEFVDFFNENKGEENYVLGFSYGAVITFLSANSISPKKIYLCSLSSDFKEDAGFMKKYVKRYIGKRRFEDLQTRSGKKYAEDLQVPSVVFYGEKEGKEFPALKLRCEETARLAKGSKLVVINNTQHKIDSPLYIEAVKNELGLIDQ